MKLAPLLAFGLAALTLTFVPATRASSPGQGLSHERLRLRNTFQTPEEVVSYYCARDASGFVWSGLLDAERKAFTTWEDSPEHDSFFVAKKYEVVPHSPSSETGEHSTRAQVLVRYELVAISDAHGTRSPPPQVNYGVTFDLSRVDGAWKISGPKPQRLAPVVLEAKFPN